MGEREEIWFQGGSKFPPWDNIYSLTLGKEEGETAGGREMQDEAMDRLRDCLKKRPACLGLEAVTFLGNVLQKCNYVMHKSGQDFNKKIHLMLDFCITIC